MISGTSTHKKITVFVVFFFYASYYKAKWAFFCSENVIKLPVLIQTPFNIFIVHMNILRVCKPTTHWWMYWEANVRLSNKNTPFFQKKRDIVKRIPKSSHPLDHLSCSLFRNQRFMLDEMHSSKTFQNLSYFLGGKSTITRIFFRMKVKLHKVAFQECQNFRYFIGIFY